NTDQLNDCALLPKGVSKQMVVTIVKRLAYGIPLPFNEMVQWDIHGNFLILAQITQVDGVKVATIADPDSLGRQYRVGFFPHGVQQRNHLVSAERIVTDYRTEATHEIMFEIRTK